MSQIKNILGEYNCNGASPWRKQKHLQKNIKELAGKPLVYYVDEAALEAKQIDKVVVATDAGYITQKIWMVFNKILSGKNQQYVIGCQAETFCLEIE
ncbi:MAG: hypothetical protein KF845_12135 [Cyclobacteriaceae bacterium]|nr:hypothetical protein [Cyclobacteriaceae bacterium]